MPLPTLPHPVTIELTQIDPATSGVDPQFREPRAQPTYQVPIALTAQLGLGHSDGFRQRPGGDDPESDGHVVLRAVDFAREAPGRKLNKGDRITKLYSGTDQSSTFVPVNWLVIETRPGGHYPRLGYTLWVLYYRDMKTLAQVA